MAAVGHVGFRDTTKQVSKMKYMTYNYTNYMYCKYTWDIYFQNIDKYRYCLGKSKMAADRHLGFVHTAK